MTGMNRPRFPTFILSALLLYLFRHAALAHPSRFAEDAETKAPEARNTWPLALDDLNEGDEHRGATIRDEARQKLQQVLGIRSHGERTGRRKVPPQFMMELYNNVADPSGVTRGRNPYNAKVVRSFIERDTSMSRFYFFNITGLEVNESVLEAELHLYRKRTPLKDMHPSTLASPYYLIRVYQVLDERSLDVPDLHRLLNVRYVGAHASGWQIFNVKQAVLAWLNGAPNLGLLVTASTLFEDPVNVEFSRRNEYHHSKQPILVLFDDDGRANGGGTKPGVPRYYTYGNENEIVGEMSYDEHVNEHVAENENEDEKIDPRSEEQRRRRDGQREEARWGSASESSGEFFQRQKKRTPPTLAEASGTETPNAAEAPGRRSRRSMETRLDGKSIGAGSDRAWDANARDPGVPTSMDIYRRAMRLASRIGARDERGKPGRVKRATKSHASVRQNVTECTRHELYVDFKEIGLSSSIIAPLGYSAYHCKGICESPLSQEQQPTNHATIQGIVHKMGLVKGVERPCCVPTKLLGTTILFFDDNENVVLKVYQDMIADRCGCR